MSMQFLDNVLTVLIPVFLPASTRVVRTMVYVRTYNVMSQLSDWKRAHMCTENHVFTNGTMVLRWCTYHASMVKTLAVDRVAVPVRPYVPKRYHG